MFKGCNMSSILVVILLLKSVIFSYAIEHDVVYPTRLDRNKAENDLSTRMTGGIHEDHASFGIKTARKTFTVNVKRNKGFHTNNILLRTFNEDGKEQKENHQPDSCYYHGQIIGNDQSDVILSTCNGLRGHLDDGEKIFNIEPIEDGKTDGAHKFYEAPIDDDEESFFNDVASKGLDQISNDNIDEEINEDEIAIARRTVANNKTNLRSLSRLSSVEPQYIKYLTTTKTRYCEILLVVDNGIYRRYGNDSKKVTERMLNLIHAVDRSYSAINIRLVLVGVEIWTDKNKIAYYKSGGAQVSSFNKYRNKHLLGLVNHDIAHFMSIKGWSGGVIGMAYVGCICSRGCGTAINLWSFNSIVGPNVVFGHELGHNFNFPHDSSMVNCTCLTSRGCFMGGSKSRRPGFTDCNLRRLAAKSFSCLNNYPKGSMENICGNGIIEGAEECDCGNAEMCKRNDPCCQPEECKLKRTSQCSDFTNPDCCEKCLFKKQGTLCRDAQTSCDLPEYCTGNQATCPQDLYRKDGTVCEEHATVLTANTNYYSIKHIKLNPVIKARFLRVNPIYKNNGGQYGLRLELMTCSADEDTASKPTPISTRHLYYTRPVCLEVNSTSCSESISTDPRLIFKREKFGDCNKPNMLFALESDGTLRHKCSGKIVCPDEKEYLFLRKTCNGDKGKYERLSNYGLRHKVTGKCVEASDGWAQDGRIVRLRATKNCNGDYDRAKLHFLEQDCILPIGMENGKLPNSAFSATRYDGKYKPSEARLNGPLGWVLQKNAGRNEYLQIDMGKMKTVSGLKTQGANYWKWTTGFKLLYSDDGIIWKRYAASGDDDKNGTSWCYSSACMKSLGTQCRDLWDAGAKSASDACWRKLNTEAAGYGTCDPAGNKSCTAGDIYCGQLQCLSSKSSPYHIKYGNSYKKLNVSGEMCSAASITTKSAGNDQTGDGLGMVQDGTKCGDKKMCFSQKCQSFTALKIKECGKVDGKTCAGRGNCDNTGKCQCDKGYDPSTNCKTVLNSIDGAWGGWNRWTSCTAACNGGKRERSRFCNTPFPAHGGHDCPGDGTEIEDCNTEACPMVRSCKVLMKKLKAANKPLLDGVYQIQMDDKTVKKMYCDMTRDGGGWTLVVSSHTNDWTSSDMVRERNIKKPDLLKDYSMLKYADQIKDSYLIESKTFEFRVEAQNRGRWGGIWEASSRFLIDSNSSSQTDVTLKKKFDDWDFSSNGLNNMVPFVSGNKLTMNSRKYWGTFTGNARGYHPAPWISGNLKESKPEHIWYWIREGEYSAPKSCMEVKNRGFELGKIYASGVYSLSLAGGKEISARCDLRSFGGGWTLMVNKISGAGWTRDKVLSRNVHEATTSKDYSILSHSAAILSLRKEQDTFHYMIEADEDKRWGGVFEGSIKDGLLSNNPSAQKPKLLKKFDNWNESESHLAKTNPYTVDYLSALLTTSPKPCDDATGVLVSQKASTYIPKLMEKPRFVRLWIREGASYNSCNQLKTVGQQRGGKYKNGYYYIKSSGAEIRPVYCDMTSDPGAWTLLVSSASGGWTKDQVLSRNEDRPLITNDYSILHLADSIKNMSSNDTFRYKLDANRFNHWGGIWEAPMRYSFVYKSHDQTKVKLLTQFNTWKYNVWYATVNNRMPWLGKVKGILTTSGTADWYWWGTIISSNVEYKPAPWINSQMSNPGLIWYWINEDDCSKDRAKVNGGLTSWSAWSKCSAICGQGKQTHLRECIAPKPRCGGKRCTGKVQEHKSCTGSCKMSPIKNYNSNYCALPRAGGCNVTDDTPLVWRNGLDKCDLPEAQFIFDSSSGRMIHNCTGKPVCPFKGSTGYSTKIVISKKNCPAMKQTRKFIRTHENSMYFGRMCIHPYGGWPRENVEFVLWSGCMYKEKLSLNLYKIAHGPVHLKYWRSIKKINSNISDLTSDVRFPNNPTSTGFLDNFDSPNYPGNYYGLQMYSYFTAPETGYYVFIVACDDSCQVFLSNSSLQKDKECIIDDPEWASEYQYDKNANQKSKKKYLEAGKQYYIEALLVEYTGADHISVKVIFPSGQESTPLDGYFLSDNAD